jgi:hypothetical protein
MRAGEEMKRTRWEWDGRRKREKYWREPYGEGIKLTSSKNEKEMPEEEDIANVIYLEWILIDIEDVKEWVESEEIVDVIESVILENEKEKEELREKDCVNGDSLLCYILWNLIDSSDVSVESVVCLSRRMLLQQISLLCSDPHSSFTRKESFLLIESVVNKGTNESMKLMHSVGLLKCVVSRMSEKKERSNKVLFCAVYSLLTLLKKRREERKKKEKEEREEEMWKDIMGSVECDGLEETVCAGKFRISRDTPDSSSRVGEELGLWKEKKE